MSCTDLRRNSQEPLKALFYKMHGLQMVKEILLLEYLDVSWGPFGEVPEKAWHHGCDFEERSPIHILEAR